MKISAPLALLATLVLSVLLEPVSARDKTGLGKPAPDFTLSGFSSEETVTLSALKGKVVLIDFWASWCHPCRQLMPRIAEIKTRFPDVEVIAISVDTDRDKALTFVRAIEPGLRPVHDT